MRSARRITLFFSLLFFIVHAIAQNEVKPVKVAVFAPIYIDSAFDDANYKLGANNLPKTILPGLEYYNGVMLAIDSLQNEGRSIEVLIYDTKSQDTALASILLKEELSNVSLMIASFNNRAEIKILSDYALAKKIPLISSTFPNDGGMTNNPYFIALNSTLKTHCEEIYKYLQRFYSTSKITLFTKKGAVENYIQSAFGESARTSPAIPLKIKTVQLSENFSNSDLTEFIDSTRKNIIICGTINEAFALRLIRALSAATQYSSTVIGMPNWDALKDLDKPDCKGIEIIYSTAYNFSRTEKTGAYFTQKYFNKFGSRPSDMAFKGFESMYHFTSLLLDHESSILDFLSEKKHKLFCDFDIRPIKNKLTYNIDYRENRKLYFIKKTDGNLKSVY